MQRRDEKGARVQEEKYHQKNELQLRVYGLEQENTRLREEQKEQGLRPDIEDLQKYMWSHENEYQRVGILYSYGSRPGLHS